MQLPIGVGDSVDGKQAVLALGANIVGEVRCGIFALNGTVYDDMSDMEALRRKFGLCRKFCTRAKRRGRTSEIYAARA
jgi:hypothetical protein